jgi:hypothetical protein
MAYGSDLKICASLGVRMVFLIAWMLADAETTEQLTLVRRIDSIFRKTGCDWTKGVRWFDVEMEVNQNS